MSDLVKIARSIVTEAAAKLSPLTFLKSNVAAMGRNEVEALAVAYLMAQVKNRRRASVLVIEREAQDIARKPKWGTAKYEKWAAVPENAAEVVTDREYRAEIAEAEEVAFKRLWSTTGDIIDAFANEMRVAWTAELLDSKFALGDGTDVRWGEATRTQHQSRLDMHQRNAAAGIEGAARHRQAISDMAASGAMSLNALAKIAA